MADIFVSYSREDRDRVEPIVAGLESAGFSVWWDRQLQGGTVFSQKIETEIQTARLVIVVWSEASLKSQWVTDEAEVGRQQNKLLPVALGEIEPPIGFRQIQTIVLDRSEDKPSAEFNAKLTDAVTHHLTALEPIAASGPDAPDASIAVLPFVNMSSDPEQEYFSDGISEELLNLLAKINQMHVTARTSSFQFKGKNLDITKIGQVLGVVHVLEGSVRKAGNRVRITAQLIEVSTGFHKWSETYDRTLDDIFAIQDEISAAIVEALKEHILGKVEAPVAIRSNSTEAYEHYLLGQQSFSQRTQAAIEKAQTGFEKSLSLDPDFLPAMIGQAEATLLLSDDPICYGTVPMDDALSSAFPILDRALMLKPESEEVHASLSLYYHLLGEPHQAQVHAEKAIELNPNCSRAYRTLGLILKRGSNPYALVIKTREKALHLDPASPTDLINLFGELPQRSRHKEAAEILERIEALEPGSVFNEWGRHSIAWNMGKLRESLAVYVGSKKLLPDRQWSFGIQRVLTLFGYGKPAEGLDPASALLLYCQYGFRDEAQRLALSLVQETSIAVPKYTLALWHTLEGRYEEAADLIGRGPHPHADEWGTDFNLDDSCLGARLSWFLREKLGDEDGARHYRQKLVEFYSARQLDFEGVHKATNYIGACVASMDGDNQTALGEIKMLVERFPGSSHQIFFDPLLEGLFEDPEFLTMKQASQDYIETEKLAATKVGLLPPADDLFNRS